MSEINYYLILDLDFDPPVEDEELIRQRIIEKNREWVEGKNDIKNRDYRFYLNEMDHLKYVMSDPEKRRKVAREAKKLVNKPLVRMIRLFSRGGYTKFTQNIISCIAKQVSKELKNTGNDYTVKDDYVIKIIRENGIDIAGDDEPEIDYDLILKKYLTKPGGTEKFDKKLTFSGGFDGYEQYNTSWTPYNFLEQIDPDCSNTNFPCKKYLDAVKKGKEAGEIKDSLDVSPEETERSFSICEEIFKNEETKAEYDKFLIWQQRSSLLRDAAEDVKAGMMSEIWYWMYLDRLCRFRLNPRDASYLLYAYCNRENAIFSSSDNRIPSLSGYKTCRNCGSITDTSDGKTNCENCGTDLFPTCPKCGADLSDCADADRCECGFDLRNLDRARALYVLAKKELETADCDSAEILIREADIYLPKSDESDDLKETLEYYRRNYGSDLPEIKSALSDIRTAISEKRYFAAEKILESLEKLGYTDDHLEDTIYFKIAESEEYIANLQSLTDGKKIINLCSEAVKVCTDNEEINNIVSRYPPETPENLHIYPSENLIELEWDKSQSDGEDTEYIIIRNEDRVPVDINDGKRLDSLLITETYEDTYTYSDRDVKIGVHYYYAIFAQRAGILSKTPLTNEKEPAYCSFDPSITGYPESEAVRLKWSPPQKGVSLELFRSSAGSPEEKISEICEKGYHDEGLENGREYTYRLSYTYNSYGTLKTVNVSTVVTPLSIPRPIEEFDAEYVKEDTFTAHWKNPHDEEISFYFSTVNNGYKCGDTMPKSELKFHKNLMEMTGITREGDVFSGTFTYPHICTLYILPVVFKSELAVLGKTVSVTRPEKQRFFKAYPESNAICLKWSKPHGSASVELYRSSEGSPEVRLYRAERDGYFDEDLENGREYTYRLRLVYRIHKGLRATTDQTIKATPSLP